MWLVAPLHPHKIMRINAESIQMKRKNKATVSVTAIASNQSQLGRFVGNKKLHNAETRAFFNQEDPTNPSGHEPNWEQVVAGAPWAATAEETQELARLGFVGLYTRLPGTPTVVPADDAACRAVCLGVKILMEPAAVVIEKHQSPVDLAIYYSSRVTEHLADLVEVHFGGNPKQEA